METSAAETFDVFDRVTILTELWALPSFACIYF